MKEVLVNPTAKIAVKKNVVKVYEVDKENKVFLKDGTEFEIELFNPTRDVILCKFKLNGKFTNDGGLILNPGQRVFLERYLDEDKKFLFETYKIDNTPEALQAIHDNGRIEVFFYKEVANNFSITYTQPFSTGVTYGEYFYYSNTGPSTQEPLFNDITTKATPTQQTFTNDISSSVVSFSNVSDSVSKVSYNIGRKEKETGRVEKGSKSEQLLGYANRYFSNVSFHSVSIKILPDVEKIYETDDLKHKKYCPECGSKLKPTDKFCSQCGHKI